MMAMREYVPGSQLLAGGKIITSRGLLKHWTGAAVANESWGLRGRFKRTSSGYFDYTITSDEPRPPANPAPTDRLESGEMIFPKSGFCTSASEPPKYGSDFEKVGTVEIYTLAFNEASACDSPQTGFGAIAGCSATYRHGGELLLLNSGADGKGFAICQLCGYADSEWHLTGQGAVSLPSRFEWHSPLQTTARGRDRRCWTDGQAPVWRHQHLAARQTTHLLKLDFSRCGQPMGLDLAVTLGQALRLAAAEVLEQDAREIRAIQPVPDSTSGVYTSVILYDTLAGGSGHLAQLSHPNHPERALEWIQRTIQLLTVEPAYPDSVRQREAMRRVLTSDMADEPMVPLDALDFLLRAQAADAAVEPLQNQPQLVPDDAWTLERLSSQSSPSQFRLWYVEDDVAGLGSPPFLCQACEAKPAALTPVILRHTALPDGIGVGRWFSRQLDDDLWQVRLRKSRGESPVLQMNQAEYDALVPLAVIQPND
jgi:hypothetical protein